MNNTLARRHAAQRGATPAALMPRPSRLQNGQRAPVEDERDIVPVIATGLAVLMATSLLALPLGGSQIAVAFFVYFGILAMVMLRGRLSPDTWLLTLALPMFAMAGFSQLMVREFSITSFLFFIVLTVPMCFRIRISPDEYQRLMNVLVTGALIIAGVVFLQHASQFVGGPFFDVKSLLPGRLVYETYVYRQPIFWGSPYDKPNGILLLEASVTSQMLAFGLIVEVLYRKRVWVLAILGAALLATFAGTGMLLLVLCAPLLMARMNPRLIIFPLIAMVPLVPILIGAGWLDVVAKRLGDFDQEGSSANARFVAPAAMIGEVLSSDDIGIILFGLGAGQLPVAPDVLWWPTTKIVCEYGVLTFVFFAAFNIRWLYLGKANFVVAWAAGCIYHVLNGSLLMPFMISFVHFAVAAYRVEEPAPSGQKMLATPQSSGMASQ